MDSHEKEKLCQKKTFDSTFLLGEMAVENSNIQISLIGSSTFQQSHFQLKFGTQACNKVVYKTILQIPYLIKKWVKISFASYLVTVTDVYGVAIFKPRG